MVELMVEFVESVIWAMSSIASVKAQYEPLEALGHQLNKMCEVDMVEARH